MNVEHAIEQMRPCERNAVRTAVESGDMIYVSSSQRVVDALESRGLVEYLPGHGCVLSVDGVSMFRYIERRNVRMLALANA